MSWTRFTGLLDADRRLRKWSGAVTPMARRQLPSAHPLKVSVWVVCTVWAGSMQGSSRVCRSMWQSAIQRWQEELECQKKQGIDGKVNLEAKGGHQG
ncbi:unnamed protein product [Lota lota]